MAREGQTGCEASHAQRREMEPWRLKHGNSCDSRRSAGDFFPRCGRGSFMVSAP